MQFNEQVKSAIPDITVAQALGVIADLVTSKEWRALKDHQKVGIAAIERLLRNKAVFGDE